MKRKAAPEVQSPAAKRVKTTTPATPRPRTSHSSFSAQEMNELLQMFHHLQSQNTHNQTLDRCIFESYQTASKTLNAENDSAPPPMSPSIEAAVSECKTILPSNVFFSQLVQLKAQIKAFRLLP